MRKGLLGGSFNPIHNGHLTIARAVAERLDLESVILLPSASPPHKKNDLIEPRHRMEMVRLAIEGDALFELSDFDVNRKGPSYTIDTVIHLQEQFGDDTRLYWIIGADWLAELSGWRRVAELVDRCTIVTAGRPGFGGADSAGAKTISNEVRESLRTVLTDGQISHIENHVLDTPLIDVSATDIRKRVANGQSIDDLVPNRVAAYIKQHGLYRK